MAEPGSRGNVIAEVSSAGREQAAARWAAVAGVPQAREDRLPMDRAMAKWNQIYALFGADSEEMRDEVFLAVNMYFWANGCSPEGKYERNIRTAGGVEVGSGDVVRIVGRLPGEIRQFLRGLMKKSYECLKYSSAIREDAVMRDKAEGLGVSADYSWLLADWLKGCEFLTASEMEMQQAVAARQIGKANARRREQLVTPGPHFADEEVEAVPPVAAGTAYPQGYSGFSRPF